MSNRDWLAENFEAHRGHLRAVAYRMLGSFAEADDAVQESWIRASRGDAEVVENLGGWLTTIVARVCLNVLHARKARHEEALDALLPDPVVTRVDSVDPEQQALIADSIGLAMLVVLDALAPTERVAFVLHDVFAVPFEEIGPIVGRSPMAARQLASRARRRVQGLAPETEPDPDRQREVVEAFLSAARAGDFDRLLGVLDPDVVLREDQGRLIRGAAVVASGAVSFRHEGTHTEVLLVNGAAGLVSWNEDGRPRAVLSFTVANGRVYAIDVIADADRLSRLDLPTAPARGV